jgi:hypothetical protein
MTQKLPIDAFFTREKSNEGISVPLLLPDGSDSGESITIRGVDSDHFRKAQVERSKKNLLILQLPEEEQQDARDKADTELLAELVGGWTMETEFNQENTVRLLTESPMIRGLVDSTSARRASFFAKR